MIKYPIYIMHYSKHIDRKKLLEKILNKEISSSGFQGQVFWITKYDRDHVSYNDYYMNFSANHLTHQQRQPTEYFPRYPLQPEVISLCLKHKTAIEMFVKESQDTFCLFLEDDAILHEGFFTKLDEYLKTLPEDFDAAFIGQGCNKRIENLEDGVSWYKKEYPADRNTDSIIFSRNFLNAFLPTLDHYRMAFPIDHEYSFWFRVMKSNVYWLEPPIVTQGSQIGVFESFQPEHSRFLDKSQNSRLDLKELISE